MAKKNWQEYGPPFLEFTEEITQEWTKLGFSKNTCKEWLEVGLKSLDYDFAYYLELQGYNPEWVLNHGSDKDLRKDYKKFLKKQPKKKQPKVQPEKPRDLYTCKICEDNTFLTFKAFVRLHGKHQLNLKDPWIAKVDRPFPNQYPGFITKTWICEECKGEKHLKTCSWFKEELPKKIDVVENKEKEKKELNQKEKLPETKPPKKSEEKKWTITFNATPRDPLKEWGNYKNIHDLYLVFRPKNLSVEDKEVFSLKFFENNKAAKEYIKANLKEGFFTIKGEYELEKDRDNDWWLMYYKTVEEITYHN
ncbi:MAG: hypothetical protein MRERV_41c016 [Mycoplasmataceae bacterium RV_VA103A]|nr:MAG: hypothetical protein MRERV_41c016 [Mycoplasmataceae bacterium RV_VA103A]